MVSPSLDFCSICYSPYHTFFEQFHVGEVCKGNAVSSRSSFGKYLAFISFAQRLLGNSTSLHACLANNAWLNTWRSRKPNPPLPLHRVNFSHAIQWVLQLSTSSPHQYLRIPIRDAVDNHPNHPTLMLSRYCEHLMEDVGFGAAKVLSFAVKIFACLFHLLTYIHHRFLCCCTVSLAVSSDLLTADDKREGKEIRFP
jgi:hypothetical protein